MAVEDNVKESEYVDDNAGEADNLTLDRIGGIITEHSNDMHYASITSLPPLPRTLSSGLIIPNISI